MNTIIKKKQADRHLKLYTYVVVGWLEPWPLKQDVYMNSMVCVKFLNRTKPAWEVQPKLTYLNRIYVIDKRFIPEIRINLANCVTYILYVRYV